MRAIVQRVSRACVKIDGETVGRINHGLLVYLGIAQDDGEDDIDYIAQKVRHLRIFKDTNGKMNRDVTEVGGSVLVVSNFTLLGDARKGRRPAFTIAARPELAQEIYEGICSRLRDCGLAIQTGRFREQMAVEATNDGPINILLDSRRLL